MGDVQIWMGRAGTGKSSRIAAEIRESLQSNPFGPKIWWIVPQDASYATEQILMREVSASIRCEVMTIQRLAERINSALRITEDAAAVNTTGRRLALADVYHNVFPNLVALRREYPSIAFLDAILQVFDEMAAHNVPLDKLESALEAAAARVSGLEDEFATWSGHSLLGKLRDLCLLYVHWRQTLAERGLFNPADLPFWTGPRVGEWPELQDAVIYVDGFDDIPPRDLEFLLRLAESADCTTFSISMDPSWMAMKPHIAHRPLEHPAWGEDEELQELMIRMDNPGQVYAPQSLQLARRIVRACKSRDISVRTEALLQGTCRITPALDTLERHLFDDETAPPAESEGMVWVAAQNARTESAGVAREVAKLVQTQGFRYRDITILVPSVPDYAAYLRESLAREQIPVYLDDFPSFASHPLAKFVLSAITAVEEGFQTESLVRLLKSDFCGLEREDADWLETYLREFEVAGASAWKQTDPWGFAEAVAGRDGALGKARGMDSRANRLRLTISPYLIPLSEVLGEDKCSPKALAGALWSLMESVDAKQTVARWMVNDGAELSPLEASLHEQAWQRMMGLLSDLAEAHGDQDVSTSFLLQVVKSDIVSQSLSTIPAGVNQVLVSDFAGARAFTSNVVFLMGAVDGVFPRRMHEQGLLSDEERIQFRRLFGQSIGRTTEERQLCERATVYNALTRATERLYITHPLSNAEGKEIRASMMLTKTKDLYRAGNREVRLWTDDNDSGDVRVMTKTSAMEYVVHALRQARDGDSPPPQLLQIMQAVFINDEWLPELWRSLRGFRHRTEAASISPDVAESLYGNPMFMNVYQLESFAACPFQHFAKFGLRLNEEVAPDITAAQRGTLLHDVLLAFVQKHMTDMDEWRDMTDQAAIASMQDCFSETLQQPESAGWLRKFVRREQAMAVLSVLENAAVVLTRHARYGKFAPTSMELSFGIGEPQSLPGFEVDAGEGLTVTLRGRIDRVDFAADEQSPAFRIIDYKSSQMDIDLSKVHHGLRLQLPVYATVVQHFAPTLFGMAAVPAALLYIPLVRRPSSGLVPNPSEAARTESLKKMRARGLMVHHEDYIGWMDHRLSAGEDSELFTKVFKKDGSLMKNAPALEPDEWQMMMAKALEHVSAMAKRIQRGRIDIAPYYLNPQDQACRHCSFASVCQMDARWDASPYRPLPKYSKEEVRALWAASTNGGVEG